MEDPQVSSNDAAAETPTQKQARLRRERREAKLKVEGTSRLEQISKVSGRQNLPEPPPDIGKVSSDPDEVDLSTHPSATGATNRQQQSSSNNGYPSEADLQAMLGAGAPRPQTGAQSAPPGDDPMMKMISQLMGGLSGGEDGAADGGLPPGLAAMFEAGAMGAGGPTPEQKRDTGTNLWRIIHAVSALCLGIYVVATSKAFGRSIERATPMSGLEEPSSADGPNLFFIFTTVELVLQSSRLFLERNNRDGKQGGWIGIAVKFLPEPYRGYLALLGRYAKIWGTVVEDAMVVVFVIGCTAWWTATVR